MVTGLLVATAKKCILEQFCEMGTNIARRFISSNSGSQEATQKLGQRFYRTMTEEGKNVQS